MWYPGSKSGIPCSRCGIHCSRGDIHCSTCIPTVNVVSLAVGELWYPCSKCGIPAVNVVFPAVDVAATHMWYTLLPPATLATEHVLELIIGYAILNYSKVICPVVSGSMGRRLSNKVDILSNKIPGSKCGNKIEFCLTKLNFV